MTTAFVDFNGVVPEKFDAVKLSHLVDAEYGNQGIDFKMVPREGFGWMNGECMSHSNLYLGLYDPLSPIPYYRVFLQCLTPFLPVAAYQVGLSFLTIHMRRAVATCTSPEVFFNSTSRLSESVANSGAITDPLSLAMETLNF